MIHKQEIKGYLLFDHGGVIEGDHFHTGSGFEENLREYNEKTDLKLSEDLYLAHGVEIFRMLYELDLNGYKFVYASGNVESHQVELKHLHEEACKKRGIKYPPVFAMCAKDAKKYPGAFFDTNPQIIPPSENNDSTVVGICGDTDSTGKEFFGKTFIRRALERVLDTSLMANSIVFDDAFPVVRAAQKEGYQVYRVGGPLTENEEGNGPALRGGTLYDGVRAFYENAIEQSKSWKVDSEEESDESSSPDKSSTPDETPNSTPFPFNRILGPKDDKALIEYMQWKAWPPINAKKTKNHWFRSEVTRYTQNLQIENLLKDQEVQRTLFNFAVYRATMRLGESQDNKRKKMDELLQSLNGKSLEEADEIIDAALQDEVLIENTGFGFFRFFHSIPLGVHNGQMDDLFARSTTEELLIELSHALKAAIKKMNEPDELSEESAAP